VRPVGLLIRRQARVIDCVISGKTD
jgi:hypothetical protein